MGVMTILASSWDFAVKVNKDSYVMGDFLRQIPILAFLLLMNCSLGQLGI